ncbi:MAG: nucleotidyltransferase family protein [Candidatus Marsarchaeota archaeon]|nr:nucleotidyltransferase family protein [Candidatus Marsarchaeota archaeon]
MDVLVLCGGYGKRLEPVSEFVPKSLLPVQGKPIVEHILEKVADLSDEAMINRVIINSNGKFAEHFRYWVNLRKSTYKYGLVEMADPTTNNETKLGAVGGINYCITELDINDDLLIIAGDNYFDFELTDIDRQFRETNKPVIALFDIGSKKEAARFGVIEMKGNKVNGFEEKPGNPKSTLISTGIYFFPKRVLPMIGGYLGDGNPKDNIGSFVSWLIKSTEVHGVIQKGIWADIGTLDAYRKLLLELENK